LDILVAIDSQPETQLKLNPVVGEMLIQHLDSNQVFVIWLLLASMIVIAKRKGEKGVVYKSMRRRMRRL